MTAVIDEPSTLQPAAPRRPRPRRRMSSSAWVGVFAMSALSLLAAWVLAFAFGLSAVQEQRSQENGYDALREEFTATTETAPMGGDITPGTPVALMQMPAAGQPQLVLVEGTASGDLAAGPGHRRDTPLPGQPGVSVIYGRSTTYGAPFARVPALVPGSRITFITQQGTFVYSVDGVRRAGDPAPPPLTAGGSRVVLVTAGGAGWRSGWAPTSTVFVDATLQGKTVDAPSGRASAVPSAELPMQGDVSALVPLLLWLQAFVLIGAVAAWGQRRWGTWRSWLLCTPLVLAILWGATDTAFRLLPNLL